MWTRAELKDRAKFAFKRNYWRSVLISLLLALLIGGGSGAGSAGSAMSSALGSDGSDITSDSYDDFYDDADDIWYEMNDVYDNTDHTALLFAGVIFVVSTHSGIQLPTCWLRLFRSFTQASSSVSVQP